MNKKSPTMIFATLLAGGLAFSAGAAAELNQPAPDFTLPGVTGKVHSLKDYAGKIVVLEWINHGCPFVKKHYGSGNMQKLQEKYTAKGVVWFSICSSAPGKQGHYSIEDWPEIRQKHNSRATDVLLDEDGRVGKAYGARTTPHMFIIDAEGALVYRGGIDDKPSTKPESLEGARNYVAEALDALRTGGEIPASDTRPYGCSVKYANGSPR